MKTTDKKDFPEYREPTVVDYGKLEDVTESHGHGFLDTPIGTPGPSITIGSTP